MKPAPMAADQLIALLAAKHHEAVFIDECKTGSSWNGARRMDAWVLLKTWSPLTTIGYEVKVNRQDFLRDSKWADYLPLCHEFNFVCPKGLIEPGELPENVGLLWATHGKLLTKRKAVRREPDSGGLVALMVYALMSRTRVVANMHEANRDNALSYWRAWLAEKQDKQGLGRSVAKRLKENYHDQRRRREQAEADTKRLEDVRETLKALGFDGDVDAWQVKRQLPARVRIGERHSSAAPAVCRRPAAARHPRAGGKVLIEVYACDLCESTASEDNNLTWPQRCRVLDQDEGHVVCRYCQHREERKRTKAGQRALELHECCVCEPAMEGKCSS